MKGIVLAVLCVSLPSLADDIQQCNGNCPSGYHVKSASCSPSCPLKCTNNSNNTWVCAKDEGESFEQCGGNCPNGYEVASSTCDVSRCGTASCANNWKNVYVCRKKK